MAVPDFQSLMLPVLTFAGRAASEVSTGDTIEVLADMFELSDDDRAQLLPSGRQTTFANRVHWARAHLRMAGLLEATRRGHFAITERGRSVLTAPPERIDIGFLSQFPEYTEARTKSADDSGEILPVLDSALTPDEEMRRARAVLEASLAEELLSRIQSAPPAFFERVVVQLLTAMGYGGSRDKAGRELGRSGDGGVDGVIDEDALGLDRIYVQAKRYAPGNSVGSGEIRDFFGALDQFKASKGLFVTTSTFTASSKATVEGLSKRIVLIDGKRLASLMIEHGVGCRVEETLYVKKLDDEFFEF